MTGDQRPGRETDKGRGPGSGSGCHSLEWHEHPVASERRRTPGGDERDAEMDA